MLEELRFDYSKLKGRIKEVLGTQEKYAMGIGCSLTSANLKLNNQAEFSQKEMYQSMIVLKLDTELVTEYFFTREVR